MAKLGLDIRPVCNLHQSWFGLIMNIVDPGQASSSRTGVVIYEHSSFTIDLKLFMDRIVVEKQSLKKQSQMTCVSIFVEVFL